jgi:exonuclease V
LNDFFGGKPLPQPQTHRLLVSDSKTRATGSMPREEDTLAGRLQVMLYKELFDALLIPRAASTPPEARIEVEGEPPDTPPEAYLPTSSQQGAGLWRIWEHLELDTTAQFTDEFIAQTRPIVDSNELRLGVGEGRTLADYGRSWTRYVAALGLGAEDGRTDTTLELVYRRAAPKRKKDTARKRRKGKDRRRRRRGEAILPTLEVPPSLEGVNVGALDEETQLQLALQLSMHESQGDKAAPSQTLVEAPVAETASSAGSIDGHDDTFHGTEPSHGEQPSSLIMVEVTGGEPHSEAPHAASATGSPSPVDGDAEMSQAEPLGPEPPSQVDSAIPSSALGLGRPTPSYTQRSASSQTKYFTSDSEQEREDVELAWAVEMSLASQDTAPAGVGVMSPPERKPRTRSPSPSPAGTVSGSIIGKHRFAHDPAALGSHLRSVLQYWRGMREPQGVEPAHVRRCHWCEFEDGCEWRQAKAAEALERYRAQRLS